MLARNLAAQYLAVCRTLVQRSARAVAQMFCRAWHFRKHRSSVNKSRGNALNAFSLDCSLFVFGCIWLQLLLLLLLL